MPKFSRQSLSRQPMTAMRWVAMTTTKEKLLTADDLLALYGKGVKGELIRGVFCETVSAGIEHGEIAGNFIIGMGNFVKPRKLGRIFGSDSGIRLERAPDTVREPDVAFISAERLPLDLRVQGYSEVVPDLVVEIASPSNSRRELNDKSLMWLHFGVSLIWAAYPDTRTVDIYRPGRPVVTIGDDGVLDGAPALPGFQLPVADVFN